MSPDPVYPIARSVAPLVATHLTQHRAAVTPSPTMVATAEFPPPDAAVVGALVDAAFWASLRREEGYVPTISLAFLPPRPEVRPLTFARPLSLDPTGLARLGPAVERPGIHLGVWWQDDALVVWGTTRTIPPYCFVVEVSAPGVIVLKHRPREESQKFVNLAVIEGDTVKIIDEGASLLPECPELLSGMLGRDLDDTPGNETRVLVQLAVSMRRHRRGGTLLVVPSASRDWEQSIVTPIAYAVEPAFSELSSLLAQRQRAGSNGQSLQGTVQWIAGLTAVDGATILTEDYDLVAFGAKIRRKRGGATVEQLRLTEPIVGNQPARVYPGQIGGTRHLSAAQFISDQRDALALVASQDGRFTLFAWSDEDDTVHAHRVDALLV